MNAVIAWFKSHSLWSHITMASILSGFGTLFTLYNTVPQFQAWCQRLNSGLPGWLEGTVGMVVAVLLFYSRTSSPSFIASQGPAQLTTVGYFTGQPGLQSVTKTPSIAPPTIVGTPPAAKP
jgi:hypothetical protein